MYIRQFVRSQVWRGSFLSVLRSPKQPGGIFPLPSESDEQGGAIGATRPGGEVPGRRAHPAQELDLAELEGRALGLWLHRHLPHRPRPIQTQRKSIRLLNR